MRLDLRPRTVVLCSLIALACIAVSLAVRGETLWQLVSCPPTEPCRARGPALPKTACELDMWSESFVAPKATRLRCERLSPDRKEQRQ